MSNILTVIQFTIAFFLTALLLRGLYAYYTFMRDKRSIITFLQDSKEMFGNAQSNSRTTRTIAAHTQLSKERVRYICMKENNFIETSLDCWELALQKFEYAGA